MNYSNLAKKAIEAREFAYAPYSKFKVGAALLGKSGKIYTGCNVESVSYGATNCAERTAVFKAVSEGETEFVAIAVYGGLDGVTETPSTYSGPCGVCRQVLLEFGEDLDVVMVLQHDEFYVHNMKELMPLPFSPSKLL